MSKAKVFGVLKFKVNRQLRGIMIEVYKIVHCMVQKKWTERTFLHLLSHYNFRTADEDSEQMEGGDLI